MHRRAADAEWLRMAIGLTRIKSKGEELSREDGGSWILCRLTLVVCVAVWVWKDVADEVLCVEVVQRVNGMEESTSVKKRNGLPINRLLRSSGQRKEQYCSRGWRFLMIALHDEKKERRWVKEEEDQTTG